MRYARIIEQVMTAPWMIRPEAHHSIRQLLAQKLAMTLPDRAPMRAADRRHVEGLEDFFGDVPEMTIVGDIATIPIKGILAPGVTAIERTCGVCDYNDIRSDISEAVGNSKVNLIVFDIDSPGGTVTGLYECAQDIMDAGQMKRTVAFTSGMMASAAMFLGASASAVIATPSSMVGSVGVILQVLDDTKAWEMFGYKLETFKAGEMKGIGYPGTTLTDPQREYLQAMVDECMAKFTGHMRRQRPTIEDSAMDGRVFSAEAGQRVGMIDRIANSMEAALALVR